jgi:hypothetical protein
MPNIAKFREDPEALLVMALEDCVEVTGKALKRCGEGMRA